MRYLIYLLLTCLCINSCKKDEIPEPEKPVIWESYFTDRSEGMLIILNAFAAKDKLHFKSSGYYFNVSANGESDDFYIVNPVGNPLEKPALNDKMFTNRGYGNNTMAFRAQQDFSGQQFYLDLNRLRGGKYSSFNYEKENGAFNTDGDFITSVIKKDQPDNICLLIFKMKVNTYEDAEADTVFFVETVLPQMSSKTVSKIESLENLFFVSSPNGSFAIAPNGNYMKISELEIKDYFTFGDKFYFDDGKNIYISEDKAQSWRIVNASPTMLYKGEYFSIGNKLYHFQDDKLYKISESDFSFSPIDSKGLETKKITSVNLFNNEVYVSTLEGLFRKPLTAFEQ